MFNCICGDYDYDPDGFWTDKIVKARKQHRCIECKHPILPGQRYERATHVKKGGCQRFKTCLSCASIRRDFMQCGWSYGWLWSEIHEANCYNADGSENCICPSPPAK